jgi:N,N'-diacetyllegionaminate synthase
MPKKARIGNRLVGDCEPCFIIAEAGSNHDGKLEQAMRLIEIASSAGADAVKFQLFRSSKLYAKNAGQSNYLKIAKPIAEILSPLEMPYDWLPKLASHCRKERILFMASAFDEGSVDQLAPHVESFKIASSEMTHIPLVRYVAQKLKPVIISTGGADLPEICYTVDEFRRTGNKDLILMQCTTAYPAPTDSLNLKTITTLKVTFDVPVGLSDHSRDPTVAPLLAIGLGANLIEKHFTLNKKLAGPDHRFALEPEELNFMVQRIREAEAALGNGEKITQGVEVELRKFARRSIFATCRVAAGEEFTPENIAVLRCGEVAAELPPKAYPEILGKRAARSIQADTAIRLEDVA